jgi:hypothetical protein
VPVATSKTSPLEKLNRTGIPSAVLKSRPKDVKALLK